MNDFWASLGMGSPSQSLNWCQSRLLTLQDSNNKWFLKDETQKWTLTKENQAQTTITYLDMEKWLAKYCTLNISLYRDPKLLDMHMQPFATALFNGGTHARIFIIGDDGVFQINEVIFTSPEFAQGLKDLKDLLKI